MLNPKSCGGSEAGDKQTVEQPDPERMWNCVIISCCPSDLGLPRHPPSPEKEFPEAQKGVGKGQGERWRLGLPSQPDLLSESVEQGP